MDDVLPRPVPDVRIAVTGLRASGVIGAIGIAFLVGMFAAFAAGAQSTGMALGWVNDVTGVITFPLALPGMFALHARIRPQSGRTGDALLVLAVATIGASSFLQLLLVTGRISFEDEIGPVSVALLLLAVWFVATGRTASKAGVLPNGTRLGILAATYVGYPIWAFRVAAALETAPEVGTP